MVAMPGMLIFHKYTTKCFIYSDLVYIKQTANTKQRQPLLTLKSTFHHLEFLVYFVLTLHMIEHFKTVIEFCN